MKIKFLVIPLFISTFFTGPTFAVSDAECAEWLCLAGGWPSVGLCPAAKAAMISRIKKHQSPLPSFGSCEGSAPAITLTNGTTLKSSNMTATYSRAAKIGAQKVCSGGNSNSGGSDGGGGGCVWTTRAAYIMPNTTCEHTESGSNPPGCIGTILQINMFENGKKYLNSPYFLNF